MWGLLWVKFSKTIKIMVFFSVGVSYTSITQF